VKDNKMPTCEQFREAIERAKTGMVLEGMFGITPDPEKSPWYRRLLCFIGIHKWKESSKFFGELEYVTILLAGDRCERCQKWRSETMKPINITATWSGIITVLVIALLWFF